MIDKPVNMMLLALIAAALLAGSWMLGKRHGEREAALIASQGLSTIEAKDIIFSLQAELRGKEVEIQEIRQTSQASTARAQALQGELDTLLREHVSDTHDLALYRRIESSLKPRGVGIESLSWSAARPEKLGLTLLQWQGRDRVNGQLTLTLAYAQAVPGATRQPEAGDAEQVAWVVELDPIAFDFRFFQKFDVVMSSQAPDSRDGARGTILPESVHVKITSPDKRLKAFDTSILWIDIAE